MVTERELDRAVAMLMRMLAIAGKSGEEGAIAHFITKSLRSAGASASAIRTDRAHKKSPIGGQVGNLIFKLPGSGAARQLPRRMLSGHLDTVPICVGCKPVRKGGLIVSADRNTGLGGDDRSGAGAALFVALQLLRHKPAPPPLTFCWPVQEEVGLYGSRHIDVKMLGGPAFGLNFDGGSSVKLTIGATGAYRLRIDIDGRAAHAGICPQEGISAITIAGVAIAALEKDGWLGQIQKRGRDGGKGTSNVGYVQAGGATNVITNHAVLRAEVRSHDAKFRRRLVRVFRQAFEQAAKRVRSSDGRAGRVRFESHLDYESFALSRKGLPVQVVKAAVRAEGGKPVFSICDGGVDANWFGVHGIDTVTIGAGQRNAHTVDESLKIDEFKRACRIGMRVATGADE